MGIPGAGLMIAHGFPVGQMVDLVRAGLAFAQAERVVITVSSEMSTSTFDRLNHVAILYRREAHKCARAKAYLAAVIMQVAALEAMLQATCSLYPQDVKRTAVYRQKKFRRKRDRALEFSLYQLIKIAAELQWLPPKRVTWAGKRADLAEFAHEVRELRNLVHPGKWASKRGNAMKFTKGGYTQQRMKCLMLSFLGWGTE
jgi:hypothetical protein